MDSEIKRDTRLQEIYQSISPASRAGIVFVLVIVAVVLIQTNQRPQATCQLIENCELSDRDLQQVQMVLGRAGLTDFEVSGKNILVAKSQRGLYLKALAEAEKLPRQLQNKEEPTLNINPFMSRTQQQMIARSEKKRQIQDMVNRLPFVEEAWLEMDASNPRSAFEPSRHSAVISIQPSGQQSLNQQELDTIRRIVTGAVASISSDQIVVTDLNAGRAYQSIPNEINSGQHRLASFTKSDDRQQYFEDEIRRSLGNYANLQIKVHYHLDAVSNSTGLAPEPETEDLLTHSDALESDLAIGTNSKASVIDSGPQVEDKAVAARVASGMAGKHRSMKTSVERVGVSIVVPRAILAGTDSGASNSGMDGEKLEEQKFEKVKSDIIEKVRPILPLASFNQGAAYPITVVLEPSTRVAATTSMATQWQEILKRYWPTLGAILIGLVLLRLVTRSEVAQPNPQPSTLSLHSAVAESEEEVKKTETQKQLSRLIDADPDTAARVLKSWIRDAA